MVRGAEPPEEPEVSTEDGLERVGLLREEGLSLRDAVKRAAKELGLSRNRAVQPGFGTGPEIGKSKGAGGREAACSLLTQMPESRKKHSASNVKRSAYRKTE